MGAQTISLREGLQQLWQQHQAGQVGQTSGAPPPSGGASQSLKTNDKPSLAMVGGEIRSRPRLDVSKEGLYQLPEGRVLATLISVPDWHPAKKLIDNAYRTDT